MIYFLVNNSYHLIDATEHVKQGLKASLIVVPHKIVHEESGLFQSIIEVNSPYTGTLSRTIRGVAIQAFSSYQARKRIKKYLSINPTDALVCYTEHEPLNQFIVRFFKKSLAQTYLMDDGVASYVNNQSKKSEQLTLKEIFSQSVTRATLAACYFQYFKIENELYPRMDDQYFDGLLYYSPVSVRRQIPRIIVSRPQAKVFSADDSLVYLSQPLYQLKNIDIDWLFKNTCKILTQLAKKFPKVLFKYHPRDDQEWRRRIEGFLLDSSIAVELLMEDGPVESLLERYQFRFAASLNSTALFQLAAYGVEPIFLYHLVGLPNTKSLDSVLSELGYNFPVDIDSLGVDYKCGLAQSAGQISLSQALQQ